MPSGTARHCPVCATPIPPNFPEGMCPRCLLAGSAPAAEGEETLPYEGTPSSRPPSPRPGVPTLETLRGLFPDLDILDLVGEGGMGAIFKARQPRLDRFVALKVMVAPPGREKDFALRFEREAQLLARLNHPHIVTLHDFGEFPAERTGDAPLFWFLMEFVDGTDLGQLIRSKELKPTEALAIVPQICEALQHAHDQGITHRDIKPANILIDRRGVVKIADFGLAKMIGGAEETLMTGLTQTGWSMGTPHYMAPEQWEQPDRVDHRADIYALGVVFYEMLTGERPAGVFEPPSRKSSPPVDKKLDGVVMRALDKNPERRYQQAGQIGEDVTRLSGANKRRPATPNSAPEPKRGPLKPLLVVGVAAALAVGGWKLWQERQVGFAGSEADQKIRAGVEGEKHASAPGVPRPRADWVPIYRQEADWAPLLNNPGRLYPFLKSHAELARDPAAGLKLEGGWVTPTQAEVKLPLPSARQVGVRMKVQMSEPGKMDGASIWLRGVDGGVLFSGNWRGIIRYFGAGGGEPVYLAARKNLVAKKPGESFTLEFFAIGPHLISRFEGDVIRVTEAGAKGTLNFLMLRNPVTDIEVINLDGLSETEALKLVGVDSATPQASFSWGSSQYAFVNDYLPWSEARKRAEASGGRLAVFESEAEEGAVRDHFRAVLNQGGYWIGGHAEKGSEQVRWISGEAVGKLAWYKYHPDCRSDPSSTLALQEGFLCEAGLAINEIQDGSDRWMTIQPQGRTSFGFIIEWDDAATPANQSLMGPSIPQAKSGRLRSAGTTANGKPHDMTRFAAHDDFVDVAGGWDRWVALRASGQTISSDGKADFTDIAKIATSFNSLYAFITSAGKLVIPDDEVWSLPPELEQGVVDAALGMQHGIALLEGGRAVVFGARYDDMVGDPANPNQYGTPRWPLPEARALEKVQAVAATVTHAGTLHEDGTLSLWGWEGPLKWEADPRQKALRELRSTEDGFWTLDEAGQLWHFHVPRNPAPGQPVPVRDKPYLSELGVTHLRSRCWRRKNGVWIAHMNTKDGNELMKEAGLSESTAFSLTGGVFDGKASASLLWIETAPSTAPE